MKNNIKWIILFWGLLFTFLLACNILLLPVSDDFIHIEIAKGGFQAAVENYMTTNARFGQCLLCWFAGAMHPIAFDFLNAVIGTIFIFLLFVLIEGRVPKSRIDYGEMSFIIIAILLATMFGSVFLWMSGATNYLWGYTLIALHWIPYRLFWKNGGFDMSKWVIVPFFFLSIFAGWSSEQVGIMSILIHLGLLCYGFASKKIRFSIWVWVGVVGFIIGFLILYFSPGQSSRADMYDGYLGVSELISLSIGDFVQRCFHTLMYAAPRRAFDIFILCILFKLITLNNRKIYYFLVVFILILFTVRYIFCVNYLFHYVRLFLTVFFFFLSITGLFNHKWRLFSIGFIVYFITLLSAIQVGQLPGRAQFAESILLFAMSLAILKTISYHLLEKAFVFVLCGMCCVSVLAALYDFHKKQQEMERLICSEKAKGLQEVIVPARLLSSPYPNIGDWDNLGNSPDYWVNQAYEKRFKVTLYVR